MASERTVILSEREGAENQPAYLLEELTESVCYTAHPYRWGVLGYKADLEQITRDDLYDYYKRHYGPDNAILLVAGDIDPKQVRKLVDKYFAALEPCTKVEPIRTRELPQQGERRCELHHPAPTAYITVKYHTVPFASPDFAPLTVAAAILSGGYAVAGSGHSGYETSRLYKALVETGLAAYASAYQEQHLDPALFSVAAALNEGKSLRRLERVLLEEVERLADSPPSRAELNKAKRQLLALHSYGMAGPTDFAETLGYFEVLDTAHRVYTFADEIAAVTGKQVQQAAAKYLHAHNRTVGILHPSAPGGGGTIAAPSWKPRRFYATGGKARLKYHSTCLSNGLKVVAVPRHDVPAVVYNVIVPGGEAWDTPAKEGLGNLTAELLLRGTTKHSYQELFERLSKLGANLSSASSKFYASVAGKALAEDSRKLLGVAAEFLRTPDFPATELRKLKRQLLTTLAMRDQDTRSLARKLLHRKLYPEGHPYWLQSLGEVATLSRLTRKDCQRFYEAHYGPAHAVCLAIGDLEPEVMFQHVEETLGKWRKEDAGLPQVPEASPPAEAGSTTFVELAGKTQCDLAIGYRALDRRHPDFYALLLGTHIFGRFGLYGRIGKTVRDEQGLAYYCFANLSSGFGPASWTISAGVNPRNVQRAKESIMTELQRMRTELVTESELKDARENLIGALNLSFETPDKLMVLLGLIELYDLGEDYPERYPDLLKAVTREQIRDVMRRYLPEGEEIVVITGPKVPQK